jgi:galactokinase
MKDIAKLLGHDVLRPVSLDDILNNITDLRAQAGDRAVLRAIHFVKENERVRKGVNALKNNDLQEFLAAVKASGNSSFKYLQNVYTSSDVKNQNVSVALAVSDAILGDDECSRVHGGGFAGTIQAFVKNENTDKYKNAMDKIFGEGSCRILKIRKYGGIKVL